MESIYLDSNATTQPTPEVVAAMVEVLETHWANPSSVHRMGQAARLRVELARAGVAELVGCKDRELVFTSGGTESSNLAIRGVLGWGGHGPDQAANPVLITTRVEHSATRATAEHLKSHGVTVEYIDIDKDGRVVVESIQRLLEKHGQAGATVLVSVQSANNETGVVQPIGAVAAAVLAARSRVYSTAAPGTTSGIAPGTSPGNLHNPPAAGGPGTVPGARGKILLHVDGTQAVGKIPVDVKKAGIDLMTFSPHKFHGPKGIAALYIRTGVRLGPQILGGPQERDRRGGTENTAGIVGFGAAAKLAREFLEDKGLVERQRKLRDKFERGVMAALPSTVVHSRGAAGECSDPLYSPDGRVWNTSNMGFPKLEAEAVLLGLSEKGLCASAGAACSSGSLEPSPVLLAMGIPPEVAHGSVRFSLSRMTSEAEIERAIEVTVGVVKRLGKTLPGAAREQENS